MMFQTHIRRGKRVECGVTFTWLGFRVSRNSSEIAQNLRGWTIRFGKWTHILKFQQIETVIGKGARYLCPVLQFAVCQGQEVDKGSLVQRKQLASFSGYDASNSNPNYSSIYLRCHRENSIGATALSRLGACYNRAMWRLRQATYATLGAGLFVALCGMPLAHAQKEPAPDVPDAIQAPAGEE